MSHSTHPTCAHSQRHVTSSPHTVCPTPGTAVIPSKSCRPGEGLACSGTHSAFPLPVNAHIHASARTCECTHLRTHESHTSSPLWSMPLTALTASQNWPEQLTIYPVHLSVRHWRRRRVISALCGWVPTALWNSQKLAFVPLPPFGDRSHWDCCAGHPYHPSAEQTPTESPPCHALVSPRSFSDRQGPQRQDGGASQCFCSPGRR